MSWSEFVYFASVALFFWSSGVAVLYLSKRKYIPDLLFIAGLLIFASFIIALWSATGHPPLRTMGETRLWYSFFLVMVGYMTWRRWRYKWIMGYTTLVSAVFVAINLLKPEIHETNLMPALQSPWFVPHVTVYILSYAMMGAATISSLTALFRKDIEERLLDLIDNLIYIGFAFLLSGMLMGALWAKEAWGDYWTWDLKEIWAFITAATYILYIHTRRAGYSLKLILWIIPLAFIMLMITWLGVSYLPSASQSVHIY